MPRVLRSAITANLPLSAVAFAAYIAYGVSNGFDFDHEFLGLERGHHGKAAWPFIVLLETYVAAAFIAQRCSGEPQTRNIRLFYVISGILGLFFMRATGGTVNDTRLCALGLYVWLSVIAYGAFVRDAPTKFLGGVRPRKSRGVH